MTEEAKTMKKNIVELAGKAAKSETADSAMKFAQAAVNLAHAYSAMAHAEKQN